MPKPYSLDLRERVVGFVEGGHSRHAAAAHFKVSVSFVVNLMKAVRMRGSFVPKPSGGRRHAKLEPHRSFLLAQVAEKAGLQLEAVMPDKDLKDAGGYKSLPVSISGTGKWDTCYRFLTGLRAMNRLTRLDSLTLASHKPDNGPDGKPYVLAPGEEPPCQITVNISTFMAR